MLLKCVFHSQRHSVGSAGGSEDCSAVTCFQINGFSHFLSLLFMSPKQGTRRADLHPVVAQIHLLITESKQNSISPCLDSQSCRYVVFLHICKQRISNLLLLKLGFFFFYSFIPCLKKDTLRTIMCVCESLLYFL